MAPNTTVAAYAAYERAITRLKTACTSLERQIPPPENADGNEAIDTPPIRPRESNVEITACQACATELEEMEELEVMSVHMMIRGIRHKEQSEH